MENLEQTIVSEYANSPIIDQIIAQWDECLDPQTSIGDIYTYILNIKTAIGFGLDIWGRILGVSRLLKVTDAVTYFGFEEMGVGIDSMGPGGLSPFYLTAPVTQNYVLGDEQYRQVLLVKALANISGSGILAINKLLTALFAGYGIAYCVPLGGMQMKIRVNFTPLNWQHSLLTTTNILPLPIGVGLTTIEVY